ncbi:D-alanyl-D-alanine carboxypeptidase [Candidatus Microgenomates bacterium]|nr:D-alanyl-D-alanine carboxypeptidase [Candidatus Microgenomates bacterium]
MGKKVKRKFFKTNYVILPENFWRQIPFFPLTFFTLLIIASTLFVSQPPPFPRNDVPFVTLSPLPQKMSPTQPSFLTARSVFVFDPRSSVVLFEKNADVPLPPVSTTKMVTAMLVLENVPLLQVVEVPSFTVEPQLMKLVPGEHITARDLLYGVLVWSANDAAEVVASAFPGGREVFIKKMNQITQELSMKNTHFTNPTGLPEQGHLSTTHDLAKFAAFAMKNPEFATIVKTQEITVQSIDGEIVHKLTNLNELLRTVPGVIGIKTGWSEESGGALVTFIERGGNPLITVVLGSADRFGDTRKLIEWAYGTHTWDISLTHYSP